jgi:cobalt/nickel transport system permease protein
VSAGPLHRASARVKLLGVFVLAVAVGLTPLDRLWLAALLLAVAALVSRVPLGRLVGRVMALAPFVVLAALGALVMRDPGRFALILSRALLVETALVLLLTTTSQPELVNAAGRLGLPGVLTSTLALSLRYLAVLLDEGQRMSRAFAARAVGPRDLRQARPLGRVIGCLAVRSLERSERIGQAMLARGFTGELPLLADDDRITLAQVAVLLAASAALVLAAGWPR